VKRVLVVEDDHEVNALICRYLQQRSYECDGAASAAQAIDKLEAAKSPDLILMDLELPDMDGAALCAEIRRRPQGGEIPVLVMTGYQQESQLDRFREAGVDAYLFKPFSPKDLLAKVNEMTQDPASA
jgi:CheY-like chemotaxis protein